MKKIFSFALVLTLLFTTILTVSAENNPSPKEEVVYGILNLDGSINNLYVVNIFNGGAITDYGNYSDIRNMTSAEKINQKDDQITITTDAKKFYYQGSLEEKELPWNITIKYFLDGVEIPGTGLAGKSGELNIAISVQQNNNIDSTFFNNYALQIAVLLDNKLSSNIQAENATVAEAGSQKQLTYTVLPGNSMDITITADVHDFEMDPITINGIKLSLGINVDNEEFTGQISELTESIKSLDIGAAGLLNGINQLSSGMQKYSDGMKAFNDGILEFSDGTAQLNTGATALKDGLSELTKQNDAIINGALAIQKATFDSVNANLSQKGLGLPVLTPENYGQVLSSIPNLAAVKEQLDGTVQFTQGLKGYTEGVSQLGQGASDLAKGTAEFNSSASVIAASANELYHAGVELNEGIKELRDGLASYKNGTMKLRKGTSGMSSEIDEKIDEMLVSITGKDDKVISFVSDKNTNVSAVQFVLKTDSIIIPEIEKTVVEESVELTFWQKLLNLFGLLTDEPNRDVI